MTILNPFKCEKCDEELQMDDFRIDVRDGKLVRICRFCGNVVEITEDK